MRPQSPLPTPPRAHFARFRAATKNSRPSFPVVASRWLLLAGATIALAVLLVALRAPAPPSLPDFRIYTEGPERKQAFFGFLRPYVEQANAEVLKTRAHMLALRQKWEKRGKLGGSDRRWLLEQAARFGLGVEDSGPVDHALFSEMTERVDIIPLSLALSQAALESGWGTSRFAREGNNFFGVWCYEPGCGIVPAARAEDATHEVKAYATPEDSFLDYILNLNSHDAYRELRRIRSQARAENRRVAGRELALGLARYSQQGNDYVSKVASVIGGNDLDDLDDTGES